MDPKGLHGNSFMGSTRRCLQLHRIYGLFLHLEYDKSPCNWRYYSEYQNNQVVNIASIELLHWNHEPQRKIPKNKVIIINLFQHPYQPCQISHIRKPCSFLPKKKNYNLVSRSSFHHTPQWSKHWLNEIEAEPFKFNSKVTKASWCNYSLKI